MPQPLGYEKRDPKKLEARRFAAIARPWDMKNATPKSWRRADLPPLPGCSTVNPLPRSPARLE